MGIANVLGMFDKLDDIIYKPVEALTSWITSPLDAKKHKRELELKALDAELAVKIKQEESKVGRELKELQAQQDSEKHKRELELKALDAELAIKVKQDEARFTVEMEEFQKDKILERLTQVAEATSRYQRELSAINQEAVRAIGDMQLELRGKAQQMIIEKTQQYKLIQKEATTEAMEHFMKIEENFSQNEMVKAILYKQVDSMLTNVIDSARDFMKELNNDLSNLNQDISRLTTFGQQSVEKLMERFRDVGAPNEIDTSVATRYIDVKPVDTE